MCCFRQQKRKNKKLNYMKQILFLAVVSLVITSCVERGKPIQKEEAKTTVETNTKKQDHYTCPNGHKGADNQGKCSECSSILVHNQAFHGNNLNIPNPVLQDPFNRNAAPANSMPSPAQNAYGDFHYTCPNGHDGGSGTAGRCTACNANLAHNQLYHR